MAETSTKVNVDGAKIKAARAIKGLNQEALAEDAGLSVRMLQKLEKGGFWPVGSVALVAAALGLEIKDLAHPVLAERQPPPLIGLWHLGQLDKRILARDDEAQQIRDALNTNLRIVSIVAPAGFGKSAILVRAVQMELGHDLKSGPEDFKGLAVLDAKITPPTIAALIDLLAEMPDLTTAAARYSAQSAGRQERQRLGLFFDFLRRAGKRWIILENAESEFVNGLSPEFRPLFLGWCAGYHEVKLIILSRAGILAAPECHASLVDVEDAISKGLPPAAALELFRRNLDDKNLRETPEPLLRAIAVERLHSMPIAIEAFAGYVNLKKISALDLEFIENNDLLRMFHPDQVEKFFFHLIREQFSMLDASSKRILSILAWADVPLPQVGLSSIDEEIDDDDLSSIRLRRSNLLVIMRGRGFAGPSYTMHALIREGVREVLGDRLTTEDLALVAEGFDRAGLHACSKQDRSQYRHGLLLFSLAERALHELIQNHAKSDVEHKLALAISNRCMALVALERHDEAVEGYNQAIAILRRLRDEEARYDIDDALAGALLERAIAFKKQRRWDEALEGCSEAIRMYRTILETEELENPVDLPRAVELRGLVFADMKRFSEALNDLKEAIRILRAIKDPWGLYESFLARALASQAQIVAAAEQFESSREKHLAERFERDFHPTKGTFEPAALRARFYKLMKGRRERAEIVLRRAILEGQLTSEEGKLLLQHLSAYQIQITDHSQGSPLDPST